MTLSKRDVSLLLSALVLIAPPTRGLKIIPPEEEIVIPAGGSFELRCEGDTPVEWSYPSTEYEDLEHKMIESDADENWATLKVHNASYMDSGFYSCSPESDSKKEISIYVYIRDLDHLLVASNQQEIISFYSSDDVVIPCKPSFPDVNVTLKPIGGLEMVLKNYDTKHGFTIQLERTTHLECVGTYLSHSMNVMYEVEQELLPDSLESPDIEIIDHSPEDHILLGQNVTLKCTVSSSPGVHLDLYWASQANHDAGRFKEETSIRRKFHNNVPVNLHVGLLTIFNVQKGDEGDYRCFVQAVGGQEAESKFILKVFDDSNKFLNISYNGTSSINSKLGKLEAVLMANIVAHPSPGITWIGPKGQQIESNEKYNITVNIDSARLIVYRPTGEDSGEYILKAQNVVGVRSLRYTLNVEDLPSVKILESPGAFLINTKKNITCSVIGYPIPSVEMFMKPCTSPKNCTSRFIPLRVRKECKTSCNFTATVLLSHPGEISCSATNRLGTIHDSVFIHTTDVPDDFHVYNASVGDGTISDLDTIQLVCGASKVIYTSDFQWEMKKSNKDYPTVLQPKDGVKIEFKETDMSYWSTLTILQPKIADSGKYICKSFTANKTRIAYRVTNIIVERSYAPTFMGASNNSNSEFSLKSQAIWLCNVTGMPRPQITWYKNGKIVVRDNRHLIGDHNKSLTISYLDYNDEGTYKCVAINKKGEASLVYRLQIYKHGMKSTIEWLVVVATVLLVGTCFILVLYQRRKLKREKKARNAYYAPDIDFFREGQIDYINPNLDIGEQADFLPYDKAWEFPREKLRLGKQLGHGAFGVVLKAEAIGLRNNEEKTIVAVKMVKKNSDVSLIKALASELKIMAHLGQHVNVVNLLGACTKNITNKELLVLVEFCKYGNLHDFLLTHRNRFVNQVNPGSGNMETIPSENSMGFPVGVSKSNSNYKGASEYDSADSNCHTMTTDMSLLSTPVGEDGYLLSKEATGPQHYQGDFNQTEKRTVCTQDLLCYAFQIAKGMEYLASRKVLHGDLAARNILLAENNVVKICDFGLAKSVYKTGIYTKTGNDLLPIKWMSIEALEDRVFSTQSDIWAYGILLWEVFSLSRTPYAGIQPADVLSLLKTGYRMDKPEYSTEDVYNLMAECWNKIPMMRPSFTECAERLGNMLEESVKQHYMDLNNPYAEFNSQHQCGRDYLSVLNPPTYVNCITSNHHEGEAVNDYVPMQHNQSYKKKAENEVVELRPMLPQPGDTSIFNPGYQGLSQVVACTN